MTTAHSPPNARCYSNPDLAGMDSDTKYLRKRKFPDIDRDDFLKEFSDSIKRIEGKIDDKFTILDNKMSSIQSELSSLANSVSDMRAEISALRTEHNAVVERIDKIENKHSNAIAALEKKQAEFVNEVSSLQTAIQFQSAEQGDVIKRTTELENITKNSGLAPELVASLEAKIDNLEQQARQCNIEITNVPERRSENLIKLVMMISNIIKCPITQKDVIAVHRVPHAQPSNNRPKNIILKLSSRILRDNVLSAFRAHRAIKSDLLDIAGSPQSIYLNEHLTLKNKILFRECREAAKRQGYKYVWVRHATVLVRESDTAPTIAIRHHKDITSHIKPRGAMGRVGPTAT